MQSDVKEYFHDSHKEIFHLIYFSFQFLPLPPILITLDFITFIFPLE